ncbi:hypothetical protein CLAIMM_15150 isoform 4, partial [Cladophialophora immunda]
MQLMQLAQLRQLWESLSERLSVTFLVSHPSALVAPLDLPKGALLSSMLPASGGGCIPLLTLGRFAPKLSTRRSSPRTFGIALDGILRHGIELSLLPGLNTVENCTDLSTATVSSPLEYIP